MARINIENDLYTRGEWFNLLLELKSADTALGALVRCWTVAQRYWFPHRQMIPHDVWKKEKLNDAIIDAGFAQKTDEGIYVNGSEEQFEWLFSASEKGKKGGLKSAQSRKEKQNSPEQESSTGQAQVEHNSTSVNPLSLSPTLSLSQDNNKYIGEQENSENVETDSEEKNHGPESRQGPDRKNKSNGQPASLKIKPEDIHRLWNQIADELGMAKVKVLNEARKKKLSKFISEIPDLEDWRKIFIASFHNQWVAGNGDVVIWSFDQVLEKGRYLKFLEDYESPTSKISADIEREKILQEIKESEERALELYKQGHDFTKPAQNSPEDEELRKAFFSQGAANV